MVTPQDTKYFQTAVNKKASTHKSKKLKPKQIRITEEGSLFPPEPED